jgi:hypothetical protein
MSWIHATIMESIFRLRDVSEEQFATLHVFAFSLGLWHVANVRRPENGSHATSDRWHGRVFGPDRRRGNL